MKQRYFFTFIILGLLAIAPAGAAQAACLTIGADLYPGDSNGSVKLLQQYLVSRGMLSATPNGYYGPATKAAVKALQTASGINPTGNVGPLTRETIQKVGCSDIVTPTPSSSSSSTPTATTTNPATISITSPAAGAAISIGSNVTISWNVPTAYLYDIILERSDGLSVGFIEHNGLGGSSFQWRAGQVITAASPGNQIVAPGSYRIRIQSPNGIATPNDPVSGWFNLNGVPLTITSIVPSSVPADNRAVVVLYGKGFDSTSIPRLDQEYGFAMNKIYTSPEGSVLIFSVPGDISPGVHSIVVGNQYSTPANFGNITITPKQ